jgi:hypothetical protein
MVAVVKRRLRPVILLLVAAQLLLSAPVVNAMAAFASAHTAVAPCAGDMPTHRGDCPCCPDGVATMATCLAACTPLVGALPVIAVAPASHSDSAPIVAIAANLGGVDDPPLKPPPIR